MARKKMYVGKIKGTNTLEYFRSENEPNATTHPHYAYTIGPFRTKAGVVYMTQFGFNNPHVQNVADCERLAKQYKDRYIGGRYVDFYDN